MEYDLKKSIHRVPRKNREDKYLLIATAYGLAMMGYTFSQFMSYLLTR